jgi:hypothetical protein
MWRFPSNYQRVVSTARLLPSQTTVALTSCNPLCASSNIVGNTTDVVSVSCRRHVSSDRRSNNNKYHAAASAPTATTTSIKNTNRYKSTAIIPPEEPAMGESLDESGYLGMILNAKVYDVAVETELQHAKSLSLVSFTSSHWMNCSFSTANFIVAFYFLVRRLMILTFFNPTNIKQYNNEATQQHCPSQTRRHTTCRQAHLARQQELPKHSLPWTYFHLW